MMQKTAKILIYLFINQAKSVIIEHSHNKYKTSLFLDGNWNIYLCTTVRCIVVQTGHIGKIHL